MAKYFTDIPYNNDLAVELYNIYVGSFAKLKLHQIMREHNGPCITLPTFETFIDNRSRKKIGQICQLFNKLSPAKKKTNREFFFFKILFCLFFLLFLSHKDNIGDMYENLSRCQS